MVNLLCGFWVGVAACLIAKEWYEARGLRGDFFLLWIVLCCLWPFSIPLSLRRARLRRTQLKGEK